MSKTLLLLGGSAAQVAAIEAAGRAGYRTVLCDYLPDNPGRLVADSFHQVSTTDPVAVLEVARAEDVDGVVAYSSDPAAPTAAYVADAMGLPGVPYEVARAFCEKHLFRAFLDEHGFNVPASISCRTGDLPDISRLSLPVIVKPTDSSGSKGVTVVESVDGLAEALGSASEFSRNGILEIEEFIVRDHPHVIEAEIFVKDGEVVSWGLMNSIRDEGANPLLPAGYTMPLDQPENRVCLVKEEVSRLVGATGVRDGAFNIEMVIDASNRLFFLDAGPRNGGNMLPEFISMASGTDIVDATVRAAMGDLSGVDLSFDGGSCGYWGLGVVHSSEAGEYVGIDYSAAAREYIVREEIQVDPGDEVRPFERCNDLLGLSFFKFPSQAASDSVMLDMAASMGPVLR